MKRTTLFLLLGLLMIAAVLPAAAQETQPTYPLNTITVSGTGEAAGNPDVAYIQLGVESFDPELSVAFNTTNDRINSVIEALVAAGIERGDIRTVGLNIYQERQPLGPENTEFSIRYNVGNMVRVTVRDIAKVADYINIAVDAGVNTLYGLEFGRNDRKALESRARQAALQDAASRARELAALIGVELGDVVVINETTSGFLPFEAMRQGMGGASNAVIEPGQVNVAVTLNITYQIKR